MSYDEEWEVEMAHRNKHSRGRYHQLVDACKNTSDYSSTRPALKRQNRKRARAETRQLLSQLRKDPFTDIDWTLSDCSNRNKNWISVSGTNAWSLATRHLRCSPKLKDNELATLPTWIRADYWKQINREHERSLDPERYRWYYQHKG
jgi:hypothetical protein